MRHAPSNRRNRHNNHRGGGGGGMRRGPGPDRRNTVFDSNGPDVRIRGTAFQIVEKYQTLAKDASSAGDRVLAENYLQHAEHYQRMVQQWAEEQARFEPLEQPSYAPAPNGFDEEGVRDQSAVPSEPTVLRPTAKDEDLGLPASILGASARTGTSPAEVA